MEAFDFNRDGKVTWEEFTNALGAIKGRVCVYYISIYVYI